MYKLDDVREGGATVLQSDGAEHDKRNGWQIVGPLFWCILSPYAPCVIQAGVSPPVLFLCHHAASVAEWLVRFLLESVCAFYIVAAFVGTC